MSHYRKPAPGYEFIFRPWITGKDGKRIYPKHGRVFCFEVPIGSRG